MDETTAVIAIPEKYEDLLGIIRAVIDGFKALFEGLKKLLADAGF